MMTLALGLALLQSGTAPQLLDDFERIDRWSAHPAEGVGATLMSAPGRRGKALRMDFDYHGGGGFAIARRPMDLDLPENYQFSFWLKGQSPANTLEFKLADSTGENVWWYTEKDRPFDGQWHQVVIRRRQIAFAWGPAGGGDIRHVASLEIVITAGNGGGKGTVWIDDLELTPKPVILPYTGTPSVTVSSGSGGQDLVDGNVHTLWVSAPGVRSATITLDFGREREFGGVGLDWALGGRANAYTVSTSSDGMVWRVIAWRTGGGNWYDDLYLPDSEGRYLRLELQDPSDPRGFAMRDIAIEPLAAGASRNEYLNLAAEHRHSGLFPRYWNGKRAWWTVVGQDGAREEALVSEDAAIEAGTGAFSIEPFLDVGNALLTWSDGSHDMGLVDSVLPIPWVTRNANGLRLTTLATAVGPAARSSLIVRYRVTNTATGPLHPTLYLAVRPFQVNPPSQFLNHPGGFTPIDSMRWTGRELLVGADRRVVPFTLPSRVGLSPFDQGEVMTRLRDGRPATATMARDSTGLASGALGWRLDLRPGDSADVVIEVPFVPNAAATVVGAGRPKVADLFEHSRREWHHLLDATTVELPGSGTALSQSITATLGYILVNRDSAAIQPGSRSYERSWIRDGALTSTALLRFGHNQEVRDFIEWYARYVAPDGRVPCCVDTRGADPVPEHDSHGEFIYLVMEYWRHTGDRALLEAMWPRVRQVAAYIDSLRQSERTAAYQSGPDTLFYGLLPPSISHEGYSAKAEHSYWDDFFGVRGLADAAAMASVIGDTADANRLRRSADEFKADLLHSINASIATHSIDFIPGSADLGDFDATSTTIALNPVGAESWLPSGPLRATFDRYWQNTRDRHDGAHDWDAYTPYEMRTVGAMLRLGETERAWTLLDEFLADQEPPAWHQWPEVVFHDPHALKFIGDLPHTWVGSDFLRSAADLFAWERESDSVLVLGQGIKPEWLEGTGVQVKQLHTWWGPLSYRAVRQGNKISLDIEAGLSIPAGGIEVALPAFEGRQVAVDGVPLDPHSTGRYIIRSLPVHITAQ